MTPYADFLYFRVSLVALLPTILHGLTGWRGRRVLIVVTTAAMLAIQYGGPATLGAVRGISELWIVGAYAALEWLLAVGFLAARRGRRRPWLFRLALVMALAPLGLARWLPLVAPDWNLGFLGISYVTLRSLDTLICIEDGLVTELPPWSSSASSSSSRRSPRVRSIAIGASRVTGRASARGPSFCRMSIRAVHRIVRGFLYKFILAALIQQHWLTPAASSASVASGISYMYAYALYLFFDFAGYSAFAIGFSYLFGIHTPENFRRPFLAPNIREFWNRWHISLSWWLRDHVYMRFVMAAAKGGWFRSQHLASHVGIILAMGLMGLWHGTQAQYILYGLYQAALLVGHDVFARRIAGRLPRLPVSIRRPAAVFITFHAVAFGFLIFSGRLTVGVSATP